MKNKLSLFIIIVSLFIFIICFTNCDNGLVMDNNAWLKLKDTDWKNTGDNSISFYSREDGPYLRYGDEFSGTVILITSVSSDEIIVVSPKEKKFLFKFNYKLSSNGTLTVSNWSITKSDNLFNGVYNKYFFNTPTGLSATAESSGSIKLTWNPVPWTPIIPGRFFGEPNYQIFYGVGSSKPDYYAGYTNDTTYTHVGLKANTTYYYFIKAISISRRSSLSGAVSATTVSFSLSANQTRIIRGNLDISTIQ